MEIDYDKFELKWDKEFEKFERERDKAERESFVPDFRDYCEFLSNFPVPREELYKITSVDKQFTLD